MTIFKDAHNKIVDEKYIQALKDSKIAIQSDIIEKATSGDAESIYAIGCLYYRAFYLNEAVIWLGTASALGVAKSQLKLGDIFWALGDDKSQKIAMEWYMQARKNGILVAYARIGEMLFSNGQYQEAEEEFLYLAERGDVYSQNRLGIFYREGYPNLHREIVGVNYDLAFKWFLKAAEQNFSQAQYNLAWFYERGYGTDVDKYQALSWYQKSSRGFVSAVDDIKRLNRQGYFIIP